MLLDQTTHGEAKIGRRTSRYRAWEGMISRCYNDNDKDWKNYGGRGIKVHNRWHVFENFRDDVGQHPGKGWSIDRWPNMNGDYGPDNWRWATAKMQSRNRRSTKLSEEKVKEIRRRALAGERGGILCREFGVSHPTVSQIIHNTRWAL